MCTVGVEITEELVYRYTNVTAFFFFKSDPGKMNFEIFTKVCSRLLNETTCRFILEKYIVRKVFFFCIFTL